MPILSLQTNVPQEEITDELLDRLSKIVAKALSKPESYVAVHIQGGQKMFFAGHDDTPCAYGCLKSIGGLGSKNNQHAKALFTEIGGALGIPGNRMYIEFVDVPATDIAFAGKTFA